MHQVFMDDVFKQTYNTLYKLDNKGNIRIWYIEQEDNKYRSIAGLRDGKQVVSEWTTCTATNVGRANERGPIEQCTAEINSLYDEKRHDGYYKSVEEAVEHSRFEPMLAKAWVKDFKPEAQFGIIAAGCFAQPKLDGVRCIASEAHQLMSREHKPIVAVPHIWDEVETIIKHTGMILDGELYNHEFRNDFNKLISLIRKQKPSDLDLEESRLKVQYWVYDAFFPEHPNMPFSQRYQRLVELFSRSYPMIVVVPTTSIKSREELDNHYGEILADEFEGQMIRVNGPYEQKRSKNLIKRKEFFDEEFTIVDIHEGNGNWSGYAKAIEYQVSEFRTAECGIKGERGEYTRDLLVNKDKYIGGQVTVRFPNKTPDGIPRFGVAYAVYDGKRDM
jgi:DNA ligase-1